MSLQILSDREKIEQYLSTLFETLDSLQAEMITTREKVRNGDKYDFAVKWGKITESISEVQSKIIAVQHVLDIID